MSDEAVQAKAHQLTEPSVQEANRFANILALGAVHPLESSTLDEFARLSERIEGDEIGLADLITRTLSPHHRHLYLLGMHLGTEFARIESSGGTLSLPPYEPIRRHATLAGIIPSLWTPLAAAPQVGEQPMEVQTRYKQGIRALMESLTGQSP
jgi:hypothetical protein